jgi:hypothetical protein
VAVEVTSAIRADDRVLATSVLMFFAASLIHFVHNAEFIAEYPGLPATWTRSGVYGGWLAMTAIGVSGWWVLRTGRRVVGLLLLAVYAALGLDSLGHYVVAPLSAHSLGMNSTILLEVGCAAVVMVEVARQLMARLARRTSAPKAGA